MYAALGAVLAVLLVVVVSGPFENDDQSSPEAEDISSVGEGSGSESTADGSEGARGLDETNEPNAGEKPHAPEKDSPTTEQYPPEEEPGLLQPDRRDPEPGSEGDHEVEPDYDLAPESEPDREP
ncbi:MAG: hypothetical protein ACQETQ_12280, partial [Spirochaetota bacterium]